MWESSVPWYSWCVCILVWACIMCESLAHAAAAAAAAEWGHVWLQLLILPDAFAMMCLSAPGNPLNVFIQAACLTHTHTIIASLALTHTLLACRLHTSLLKPVLFLKLSRDWSMCLHLQLQTFVAVLVAENLWRSAWAIVTATREEVLLCKLS